MAEGVFTVICMFTEGDEYVLYYHSGKKTLRVFRVSDCEMIANYRMQAELTAIRSTADGKSIVLGTVDGCISVLAIADPQNANNFDYLQQLPSRDPDVSNNELDGPDLIHTGPISLSVEEEVSKVKGCSKVQSSSKIGKDVTKVLRK